MKKILPIVFVFSFHFVSGQSVSGRIFVQKNYVNGNFFKEVIDTVQVSDSKIDIFFFKKFFFSPYHIPERFINRNYRNQSISVWADPKGEKDYKKNWEYKYAYDSLGRIIKYSYSSCFICSQLPYSYIVKYNSLDLVEEIYSDTNTKEVFRFYYNVNGDIVRFQKFIFGVLDSVIEVLN